MSVKRIFGIILSVLGIGALIYTAITFMNTRGSMYDVKLLLVYGILGLIFFSAGIGLIKGTKDEPA